MVIKHILFADGYTKKIAYDIAKDHKLKAEFFRIHNPTFHRWRLALKKSKIDGGEKVSLPSNSMLIGGNRWRHHFALDLTNLPIIMIDAHTDLSYDEMILLKLIRPYNWLYFRLLKDLETHLILPYDRFRWGRWDLVVPERYADKFNLYSFNKKSLKVKISLSAGRSKTIKVRDPEKSPPILRGNKQISLDFDVTREIHEDRVVKLIAKIAREGDVCDIWLDEGKMGNRKTLEDHTESCLKIFEILNSARVS